MKNTVYRRHKSNYTVLLVVLLALLLLLGAFAAAYFITPNSARPLLEEGDVLVSPQQDGAVSLSWPEAGEQAAYLLYLCSGEEKNYSFAGQFEENRALLSGITLDEPLHLRIQAVAFGKNLLGMTREMLSQNIIEVSVLPQTLPSRPKVTGEPHEDKTLSLSWTAGAGCDYQVCSVDSGQYTPLTNVTAANGTAVVHFGAEGDMDMPSYDAPARVSVRPAFHGEGYILFGDYSMPVTVDRESLLGNELSLEFQETGERLYTLRWNETKGDYYEIQEWDGEYSQWETLVRIDRTDELVYETGRLGSGTDHRYRVAAYDQEAAESFAVPENNGFSAEPDEISFRASVSPLYATIWPIMDLKLFDNTSQSNTLATVPGGTALCVLEESGNWFYVRYKDSYGYIDNRFCMINLPEYVGDACSYNITNSYRSIFKVHEYPIENITWQVIQGFENIQIAEGEYLVPYLYPSSKKLLAAAEAAEADGYRLKIYEAYRPNEATRFLYDTTLTLLDNPVPPLDEAGRVIDPRTGLSMDPETGFLIHPENGTLIDPATIPDPEPEPEDEEPDAPTDGEPPAEGGAAPTGESQESGEGEDGPSLPPEDEPLLPGEVAEPNESSTGTGGSDEGELEEEDNPTTSTPENVITLGQIMTDGRFKISSFLAAATSAHNRGIALDLTLETLDGEELAMQAPIHDLSWHAATYLNNDNAKLLEHYMKGVAGLNGLTSEWWHFQDDATRNAIKLNTYLYKGVSAEGWVKDDTGWRYRRPDGSFHRGSSVTVDGKTYSLDGNGYVSE